ncbi:unnamed protein product [Adineta steineri]|uniref:YihY/virulence factor BrkB family protein n=1 Tax=Adineta steineri TaxID=433720 RepID=A0A815DSZ2_9BILA|nr:unnamed protein product [Adineta steineri]CAF1301652.1 unnamed protein product [Adineta steineri]CAF3534294.1 unnamed protein product [Adineta steineri]CAF3681957.1 unnamed protein product [Adineta steineri]
MNLTKVRGKLSLFGWKIIYDWSFSLAALIAYYLLISLLPLILSMFAVISLIFGSDAQFQTQIRDRLIKAFPEEGLADVLDALLASLSKQAGLVLIISFVISMFTGSRLFVGLDDVLTIVYRIRERTILNQNILAIKMISAFVIIMPFIIIFSSLPAILQKHESFYQFLTVLSSGILSFVFFQLIYIILPKRPMSWRNTWCGSLIAAVGLQILLLLFPLYVHEFMANYVGQLGFIIITLLLFYLFGLLFVICAQINAFFFDHVQPLTTGLGTCLSEFSDREQIQLVEDDIFDSRNTIVAGLDTIEHH